MTDPAPTFPLRLRVNGRNHQVPVTADDTLLDVLRRELRYFSCRETCGLGLCGSCTVVVDGRAVSSCLAPAFVQDGADVRTAEGLEDSDGLHPVQQAFVDEQAFQCSFCTPGFLMSVVAMLEDDGAPDPEQALTGHLCRCGSYRQIQAAVDRVVCERTRSAGCAGSPAHAADRSTPETEETR
jgi:aerobic-type carbon monoxide dehydrogenase small subunit (CoxS/CutS family)